MGILVSWRIRIFSQFNFVKEYYFKITIIRVEIDDLFGLSAEKIGEGIISEFSEPV